MDKVIKLNSLIVMFLTTVMLVSCTSDMTQSLGGGYVYCDEGGPMKDIYCEDLKGKEVPATVVDYAYDSNYIVAKQLPKIPQEILYSKQYEYKDEKAFYYWIVVKKTYDVYGPLDIHDYKELKRKLGISNELDIK